MLLGQGTLRPDVIESGDERVTKGKAHTIKTHHNAVEALKSIPKVEPLIELFKDQVRQIALKLDLQESFAYRQPYPGPGLYCRIIGSYGCDVENNVNNEYILLEKRVQEAAKKRGFNAHVLPVKTVGVQGDERSYKHPVIVSGDVDWKEFAQLALDLPNEIREINRVLYTPRDLTAEQARGITTTLMAHDVIRQSQECDLIMRQVADEYGYNNSRKCSQMPGILIPCNFGEEGKRSFVIRPTWTRDFMAIIGMMPCEKAPLSDPEEFFPEEMFFKMADEIKGKTKGIARVILDATDKPPASTEWE
jgi:GMP synthase (glutamine-hydrolysing)